MTTNKENEEIVDNILEELFEQGKKYGEEIGYAKDEMLYEIRSSALSEAKKALLSKDKQIQEAVEAERERIKQWAQSKKDTLTMKWDTDKAKSTVYDAIIFNWNDFPQSNNK